MSFTTGTVSDFLLILNISREENFAVPETALKSIDILVSTCQLLRRGNYWGLEKCSHPLHFQFHILLTLSVLIFLNWSSAPAKGRLLPCGTLDATCHWHQLWQSTVEWAHLGLAKQLWPGQLSNTHWCDTPSWWYVDKVSWLHGLGWCFRGHTVSGSPVFNVCFI